MLDREILAAIFKAEVSKVLAYRGAHFHTNQAHKHQHLKADNDSQSSSAKHSHGEKHLDAQSLVPVSFTAADWFTRALLKAPDIVWACAIVVASIESQLDAGYPIAVHSVTRASHPAAKVLPGWAGRREGITDQPISNSDLYFFTWTFNEA